MKNILLRIISLYILVGGFFKVAYAQEIGLPLIHNYSPKEYNSSPQVWSVLQDKTTGIMYFGCGEGVLSYDGVKWRTIPTNTKVHSYSLSQSPNGKIYVATIDDFGYLQEDKQGKSHYQSLSHLIGDTTLKIGNVWSVKTSKDKVYFHSYTTIFEYDVTKHTINLFKADTNGHFIGNFVHNNTFYTQLSKKGLMKIEKGQLVKAPQYDFFKDKNVFLPYAPIIFDSTTYLIPTRTEKFYLYNPNKTTLPQEFALAQQDFLMDNNIYAAHTLQNNQMFLFASKKKAALLVDRQGNSLQRFGEETGLQNENFWAVAHDQLQNLWFGLDKGIAKAEYGQALRFWSEQNGLKGTVTKIYRFNGKVYAATNQTVYRIDQTIQEVKGMPVGQNWTFLEFKIQDQSIFLVGNQYGIYQIKDTQAQEVYKNEGGRHCYFLYQSEKYPNRLYGTDLNTVIVLQYEKGKFTLIGKWEDIKAENRMMIEDSQGELWIGSYSNGILRITLDETNNNKPKQIKYYGIKEGLPSLNGCKGYRFKDQIIWATQTGIYRYQPAKDSFEPFCELGSQFCVGNRSVKFIQVIKDRIYIASSTNKTEYLGYLTPNSKGNYDWVFQPFRRLPEFAAIESMYIDEDGVFWLGGSEGLFMYDQRKDTKDYAQKFSCFIRKIRNQRDSVVYGGESMANSTKYPSFNYTYNSLKFEFAAPFFDQEERTLYRYQLVGYDSIWSKWSRQTEKEYTNLWEGTYTFKVQAKNIYEVESNIASYTFIISPPWYRTWWVYNLYIALATLLIWGIVKWNTRRLKKEKEILEGIVVQRTAEVVKQKEEISQTLEIVNQQKEEISQQAEELQQVNEEISTQRDAVQQAYENVTLLSEIGKKITANLHLDKIVETIYGQLNELMPAEILVVGVYNPLLQRIEMPADIENGEKMPFNFYELAEKNCPAVWCFENCAEFVVGDYEKEYNKYFPLYDFPQTKIREQICSIIYLPLQHNKTVIGVLSVQSFQRYAHTSYHLNILRNVATYTSIAIENADFYKKLDAQKGIIESKNQDIFASINAALRIQEAMLPSSQQIGHYLEHFFILYRPRDIVSGDFYWFAEVARSQRTASYHQIMIVADCTGHGVPGAFMSMVGYNLLNEIVKTRQTYSPDLILTELNEGIKNALQQTEKGGREGMDMAVVGIEKYGEQFTLYYAGAMNPLYYIQNKQFYEIKGDKLPIGGEDYKNIAKSFTLHTIDIVKTNEEPFTLYLCTDGYQDQFGGEKGKKFMTKQLKETLFQMYYLDMSKQYQILNETFDTWKGSGEQVDDVTVIGVKL